jgi:hypothetical protein
MAIESERWVLRTDRCLTTNGYAEFDAFDTRDPKPKVVDNDHLAFATIVWTMQNDLTDGTLRRATLRCRERAKIMLSALDMLAALKAADAKLRQYEMSIPGSRDVIEQTTAAIAKAEGRS